VSRHPGAYSKDELILLLVNALLTPGENARSAQKTIDLKEKGLS
jgi:hypothetical protein